MFSHFFPAKTVFSISLLCCYANSFAFTGNDLQGAIQAEQQNDVNTYISGVVDGYRRGSLDVGLAASVEAVSRGQSVNGITLSYKGAHCFKLPDKTTHTQIFQVVRTYLSKHPESLHKQAADLVLDGLAGAFPCK